MFAPSLRRRVSFTSIAWHIALCLAVFSPASAEETIADQLARLMQTASVNPEELVKLDINKANADDRDKAQTIAIPCLRAIHSYWESRLPELQRQRDIVASNMPNGNANGTVAQQALNDAEGYIRITNIVEMALTNPHALTSDADYLFNKELHDQLVNTIDMWKTMPNNAAAIAQKRIEEGFKKLIPTYKAEIIGKCK